MQSQAHGSPLAVRVGLLPSKPQTKREGDTSVTVVTSNYYVVNRPSKAFRVSCLSFS